MGRRILPKLSCCTCRNIVVSSVHLESTDLSVSGVNSEILMDVRSELRLQ